MLKAKIIYYIYREESKSNVSAWKLNRKNGANLFIMVLGRLEKCIIVKNSVIFPEPFFSKMFSLKYIALIVAAKWTVRGPDGSGWL